MSWSIHLVAYACCIGLLPATAAIVTAEPEKLTPFAKRALGSLAREHAMCAAYTAVASKCMSQDEDQSLRHRARAASSEYYTRGQELARTAGLEPDALMSQAKQTAEQITTLLESHCINMPRVLQEHAQRCDRLMESPEERAAELMSEMRTRERQGR